MPRSTRVPAVYLRLLLAAVATSACSLIATERSPQFTRARGTPVYQSTLLGTLLLHNFGACPIKPSARLGIGPQHDTLPCRSGVGRLVAKVPATASPRHAICTIRSGCSLSSSGRERITQ